MREESHLDDMREAIRGDFERLAKRRGSQELMREPPPEPEEAAEPVEVGDERVEDLRFRRSGFLARLFGRDR